MSGNGENMNVNHDKILASISKLTIFDLPIPVYAVSVDGQLIKYNKWFKELFELNSDESEKYSILSFYRDPSIRNELKVKLDHIDKNDPDKNRLNKEVLDLIISNEQKYVYDTTSPIKDHDNNEIIAYIACMVDVTDEERYRKLFDNLPIGIYKLDKEDRVVQANETMYKVLGNFESFNDVKGKHVQDFYVDSIEANRVKELLNNQDVINNHIVILKKKNGEAMYASITTSIVRSRDGQYVGREGAIIDVTTQERYRRLLEDVPVGLYDIRIKDGIEVISHCNRQFIEMWGFKNISEVEGYKVEDLHPTKESYQSFLRELNKSSKQKLPLTGYKLHVKTRLGIEKVFDVNCSNLIDANKNIIGRVGAIIDITQQELLRNRELALRQKIEELSGDIGAILHSYASMLVMIKQSMDSIMMTMAPDPFHAIQALTPEQAANELLKPAHDCALSVDRILTRMTSEDRRINHPEHIKNELHKHKNMLSNFTNEVDYVAAFPPTLHQTAYELLELHSKLIDQKLPREYLKQLKTDIYNLFRICNLTSLHKVCDSVIEMDHQVNALREFILSDDKREYKREVVKVHDLIEHSINRLVHYARSRKVSFRLNADQGNVLVDVVEHELIRAFGNIIHNAIKYSWKRGKAAGDDPWVSITIHQADDLCWVEIENWGVPITVEEIKSQVIFNLGYRGSKAEDRGRTGTGIGLTDARRVVRDHSGDIFVESHPAVAGGLEDDYNQPFLTTVKISLPKYKGK